MAKKVWVWNDFTGGTSGDKYVGKTGSFYDARNVNVHDSPRELKLAKQWTKYGATDGGGGT